MSEMLTRKRRSPGLSLVASTILTLAIFSFLKLPSHAAEIICVKAVTALEYSTEEKNRILEYFPSGRLPTATTCLTALIKGTIGSGDSAKFSELLNRSHPFLSNVMLWSSGGSVEEAMRIGRLIRKGLIETSAPIDITNPPKGWGNLLFYASNICNGYDCHCASACLLIWAAGVERTGNSLGLHRPRLASTKFATLPPDRASVLYRQLLAEMANYLTEMEIPRRFVELMTDTASNEIRWLTWGEADALEDVPSVREWLASSCGAMTKEQRQAHAEGLSNQHRTNHEQMLFDLLDKKQKEIFDCNMTRMRKSRDAIGAISDR